MPIRLPGRGQLFFASLFPFAILFAQADKPASKPAYGRDVEPILKAHCVSCHGSANPAGGLDLTNPKAVEKNIDRGNPQASVLLQRIKGLGGKPQMPMGFPPLPVSDVSTVERWIAVGASFEPGGGRPHWAYVAPVRPPVPALGSTWVRNPIDAFVLAKLRTEGLHPSPEASKETLLRRVSLDLIGLPPTPAEMDAFLADKRPNAYEKVIDRLLASPHYGERQARGWLDLARYADTDGYEKDLNRTAWPYRDWVIDAFNRNLRYDQFTIKQLAGDLLPNPTLADLVATGFHRNTMQNLEGGVDQDEAHFAVVLDRVDTTATVWLGSTLACARCHDHKYDPFTQRDYYKMAAFFSNSVVIPRGPKEVGEEKWFESTIPAPTPEQASEETKLKVEIAALQHDLATPKPEFEADYVQWRRATWAYPAWAVLGPKVVAAAVPNAKPSSIKPSVPNFTIQEDRSVLVGGPNPDRVSYYAVLPRRPGPATGLRLQALTDSTLAGNGPGRAANGNFVLTGLLVRVNGQPTKFKQVRTDFVQKDFSVDHLGDDDAKSGWAVMGALGASHTLIATFADPVPVDADVSVTLSFASPYPGHSLGRFRLSTTDSADPMADLTPQSIRDLLTKAGASAPEEKTLRDYYFDTSPALAELRARLQQAQARLAALEAQVPTAMIMRDKPATGPLTAYIHHRGEFLSKTELVAAGPPAVLPPMKAAKNDRLALAQWLVDKANPLTARVEVNRIWEQYFGRGLVETSEDFGTRGSVPTHPEMLDWLATEFMSRGWDMKAIHRMIVLSATYRQSSDATADRLAKDPQNLYYARGPRFRLDAEIIRDNALAAGGLLSLKMGGPSAYPYQPEGIWDSPYSGQRWAPSTDADRYRRSIYTFWKRTAPYPAYVSFDATSRESCTVRRIRTNTPLQALTLLNDREMIEAAGGLARRMEESGPTEAAHLAAGFRICTGRNPHPAELARLSALLAKLESRYTQNPKAAAALAPTPQSAAWTMVGNVLLNLDETITKE